MFSKDVAYCHYRPAAWLRVTGADAGRFLQGQFSNDLEGSGAAGGAYGLWLDHKGRVQADGFVIRDAGGDAYWIASYASPAAVIRERLERFIVADEVEIEDRTGAWEAMALLGTGAGPALAAERGETGVVFRGRRASGENWEWLFPAGSAAGARALLAAARELLPEDLERLRIAEAIPSVPADIGPADLPHEGGLDGAAVSYTKGCFVGQEVMSRLRSLGRIRRGLARVRGRGALPPLPAALLHEGKKAGELRTAIRTVDRAGFEGLALVSLEALRGKLPLTLAHGYAIEWVGP